MKYPKYPGDYIVLILAAIILLFALGILNSHTEPRKPYTGGGEDYLYYFHFMQGDDQ